MLTVLCCGLSFCAGSLIGRQGYSTESGNKTRDFPKKMFNYDVSCVTKFSRFEELDFSVQEGKDLEQGFGPAHKLRICPNPDRKLAGRRFSPLYLGLQIRRG